MLSPKVFSIDGANSTSSFKTDENGMFVQKSILSSLIISMSFIARSCVNRGKSIVVDVTIVVLSFYSRNHEIRLLYTDETGLISVADRTILVPTSVCC